MMYPHEYTNNVEVRYIYKVMFFKTQQEWSSVLNVGCSNFRGLGQVLTFDCVSSPVLGSNALLSVTVI